MLTVADIFEAADQQVPGGLPVLGGLPMRLRWVMSTATFGEVTEATRDRAFALGDPTPENVQLLGMRIRIDESAEGLKVERYA